MKKIDSIRKIFLLLTVSLMIQAGYAQALHKKTFPDGSYIKLDSLSGLGQVVASDYYLTVYAAIVDTFQCPLSVSIAGGSSYMNTTDIFSDPNAVFYSGNPYLISVYLDAVGPNVTRSYGVTGVVVNGQHTCGGSTSQAQYNVGGYQLSEYLISKTESLHAPIRLGYTVDTIASLPYVTLSWNKGTDMPDGPSLRYNVYRDNVLIAAVASTSGSVTPGGQATWQYTDSVPPGGNHTYSVSTYTDAGGIADPANANYSTSWPASESPKISANVFVFHILNAADGATYNRCQLTWPNLANFAPNNISVSKDGVQLAVVDKNTTTYNDYDGVPGKKYDYAIAPILANNTSPKAYHDTGYSKPNGIIKGNVYSVFNAAVSGVTLYASATVDGLSILDSTVSDASGFYQFEDLYYDTSAVYTIVPHKGTHKFNPDTLTRTLLINDNTAIGVNFTDTSVFTVRGAVTFSADPHCPNGCHPQGVIMYNNGAPTNGITAGNGGAYAFTIQQQGTYTIKPVFPGHKFSPDSIVLNVVADVANINFTDVTVDTLFIDLRGGCGNEVAHHTVASIGNNFGYSYATDTIYDDQFGHLSQKLVLPAQPYSVSLINTFSNGVNQDPFINTYFSSTALTADLTMRDSVSRTLYDTTITTTPARIDSIHTASGHDSAIVIPAHTTMTIDTLSQLVESRHVADFIYHSTVNVDVVNFPISPTCNSAAANYGYIMNQGINANLRITIQESYTYSGTTCPVDSGILDIYDDVSDQGLQTVNFRNGVYIYTVSPGVPNIAPPYLKLLQVFAHVGAVSANWFKDVLVTGHRPHTQTFVTRTPELPFFILHAPPGNNSYSYLAKDSSVNFSYSTSYQKGGSAGPYLDAKIGAGVPIPFTGISIGSGTEITADATFGRDSNSSTSVNTTFTAHTQVSTANANGNNGVMYSGHAGDVYVGASFNMIYAMSDVISVDSNCNIVKDTTLAWGANGLATNYIYTEDHILNTLIPQLNELKALASHDSAALIQSYIDVWNQVVQKNHNNADSGKLLQNISFSSGINYDNSVTTGKDSSISIDYAIYTDVNAGLGIFFGENLDAFANTQLGVKLNMHWNTSTASNTDINITKTYGYHLEDDNQGNVYSTDVRADRVYGSPAFTIVAGASACPHWPGTQARDSANIFLDTRAIANVPITQTANYTAHIVNLSESNETRTYSVAVVPESNPDGAIISIGGQQINNSAANFTVPAGTDLPVILTVAPGPIASDYNNLEVSVSSPCDGGEGNTIDFEAHFQSTCSPIGIYTPSDNWLVNASNHDSLLVIFSGYDAHNPLLQTIGLEYRQPGGTWIPATNPPIQDSVLTAAYYSYLFNTSALPDGNYELRAYANCGSQPGGRTYSAILSGTIDRSGLSLFGTPTPADGVLNITQNISVAFNGSVDCGQAAAYTPIYSSLVRADNGQLIPDSVTCNGNQLIIYTNPPGLIDSFENMTLTATINNVYDIYGNSLQQPIVWSFLVSRSKVYWNPSSLNINATTGLSANASATLYNVGTARAGISIVHMPSWLSTPPANDTIASGTPANPASLSIPFTVSASLNSGSYSDTVIVLANGKLVYLFVHLDVTAPSPTWSVNANNFQYSMNITANYSTTSLNTPLSTDTRDIIAAFVGNQCRGVGHISYDPISNKYSAFITAYSNSVVGDTFTFRMWDALPGKEYQAAERLPFVSDGTIGQPLAPYILHAGGEFETIKFAPGWNWFSLNVAATDMSPKNVLSSITGNNGAVVKTQNAYDQFTTATTGWTGSISAFNTNTSYMIFLDHADTLHFLGKPITDTSIISIASGWNWVGFPRQKIATAGSYLSNVNATGGDLLKSETQFTQYNAGSWTGSLLNMYPGQGYKLKTTNAFNFVIPPDRSLPGWSADENKYQQNMTVTADLQFNGISTIQSHYLIGAFVNGICVGTAQPEFLTSLNLYRAFITLHGDTANQAITFKVYDTDNDIEYIPTYAPLAVMPDTVVGRVESAYVINVQTSTGINALTFTDGYSLLQNVPNPFAKTTTIQYTLPSAQQVTMTLYDESGRMIRELVNGTQVAGTHSVSFEQDNLQSGIYFYQMKAGDFVKTRRMMILQQ